MILQIDEFTGWQCSEWHYALLPNNEVQRIVIIILFLLVL